MIETEFLQIFERCGRGQKKIKTVKIRILPTSDSVLRLQTGVPTDTIAHRISVKLVGRDDGVR